MALPYTVDDMIAQVRDGLDEDNTAAVSDERILRSLNRAQRSLVKILSKKADWLLYATTTLVPNGTRYFDAPVDAFNSRVETLFFMDGARPIPLSKLTPRRAARLADATYTGRPAYYTQEGNKIVIAPIPAGGSLMVKYVRRPEALVKPQGRIVAITSSTLTVEDIGEDISTTVDDLKAFINVVNGITGEVKGSYQINSINGNVITIKTSSLDREAVYGRTIASELAADIAEDDYICVIGGTCVPEIVSDFGDFLVASAVLEIKRSLGEEIAGEAQQYAEEKKELEELWAGRERSATVYKRSTNWGDN